MKVKSFKVLYLENGNWKSLKDNNNKDISFISEDAAKRHVDIIRSEGKHPLCVCHHVVIYQFNGLMLTDEGIRY